MAFIVGQQVAEAGKIWIERGVVLVDLVHVTASRIGLPYFNQRAPHRVAILVNDAAAHHNTLAQWFARAVLSEIGTAVSQIVHGELRAGDFR